MHENMTEVYLLNEDKINDFFPLKCEEKTKVIELGLVCYKSGIHKGKEWTNESHTKEIEGIQQYHKREKEEWKERICGIENSKNRRIEEIEQEQKHNYSNEIKQLNKAHMELTTQLTEYQMKYNEVHTQLDEKYNQRLREKEIMYEKRIDKQTEQMETIRKQYDERMQEHVIRTQKSTYKGQDGEEYIQNQLNMLFPKAEIEDTHSIPGRGDFIMRDDDLIIMIENKNYSKNVQKSEIDKFYRDMDSEANKDIQCGILVSLNSGICCKEDFELEIRNNKPILFLHRLQDNLFHLRLAIKFFKLILNGKKCDFSNAEITGGFKNIAKTMKRNFTKQKKLLDKYHNDQLAMIAESETWVGALYSLLHIKY
jgi:hypothetical protein